MFGTLLFQSKVKTLFDIKRKVQKGYFCSFAENGRDSDPQEPPSCAPVIAVSTLHLRSEFNI